MAMYKIQGQTLTEIADAIRSKTGRADAITPEQMAQIIESAELGGEILLQEKTCTPTGQVQVVTADSGYQGLSKVTVEAGEVTLPDVEAVKF